MGTDGDAGAGPAPPIDRVLSEVAELVGGDRPEVVADFARAALRRVPAEQLAGADPRLTARQLVDAFRTMDAREGAFAIRVLSPDVALDGWSQPGTVVHVSAEDRPFLLSTVTEELEHRDLEIVRSLHPIMGVRRGEGGRITEVLPARHAAHRETLLHLEVDDELDAAERRELSDRLEALLADVVRATDDHSQMRNRVEAQARMLREDPPARVDPDEAAEVAALLEWFLDDNLVLLGWREYQLTEADGPAVQVVAGSGLGILRDGEDSRYTTPVPLRELSAELRRRFEDPRLLTISRTNRLSTVHRRTRMDYVGITAYDDGRVVGERRLLGLLTRKAYTEPAASTPVLRRKLATILEREDVVEGSHDESVLIAVFHAIPKDELFQADVDELQDTVVGLLSAEERGETRVILRTEEFTRTVSVLVAVPRDRYTPDLRKSLEALFRQRFGGHRVDVDLSLGDRTEAIARFTVHVDGEVPDVDEAELQRDVRRRARSWTDDLVAAITTRRGEVEAHRLARRYVDALPRAYGDLIPVERAIIDLELLDAATKDDLSLLATVQPPRSDDTLERLKLIVRDEPLVLSDILPIIESLGLRVIEELPFGLDTDAPRLWIHDFGIRDARDVPIDVPEDGPRIAEALTAAWEGRSEVDSLNRLVLAAGITWQQVTVLRALRRLRRQLGTAYTPAYVNEALTTNPAVAAALMELFNARFDPDHDADAATASRRRTAVIERLDDVERLDHDRILRGFLALIDATVRTNAFQDDTTTPRGDHEPVPYLSLKMDSREVAGVPRPVPYREIFVYSPDVEGVHLRGGPVARGGVRWSDRQDDVRTEILELMKAQMLKNAVIVPTGAKGGFVLKRPPAEAGEHDDAVRRAYITFIRGLLDVTDNLVGGEVVPPDRVRRHDGDDPYLVVAADRGTAALSDVANDLAAAYDFWLGDAFASGGSAGYDHKELGITARGAWVAVRRHFRELGIDVRDEPFRVVGIGDMSGDVFGNGMLQARTIRLVAAFDHRDIFLDPDPDAEASFAERRRLFETPSSTWQDYDRGLISEGGGVFARSAKSIELTDEIRRLLRIDDTSMPPAQLIRAILRAPVDLLFAGGIGTYVKASTEVHEEIGDRANDELRIDASELRARVVGEGANLAFTQAARIQYARRGGRINQDAVDNAAGVDTSDHEVNLKILLALAVREGRLDPDERDAVLTEATDEVVASVLRDVDLQTRLLTQEAAASPDRMDAYEQVMTRLEEEAVLDREVAVLPDSDEMNARAEAGAGLTRPELASLMGAVKTSLSDRLLGSDLPEDPALAPVLEAYFPESLVVRFGDLVRRHRLRRELVATRVANHLVDHMGITFVSRVSTETGVATPRVVAAYWAAREVAGADPRWEAVEEMAGTLAPERILTLKRRIDDLVDDLTRTYAEDPTLDDPGAVVERDRDVFATLVEAVTDLGTAGQRSRRLERARSYMDDLVERDLAVYLAAADDLAIAPDVAAVTRRLSGGTDPVAVADAFLHLGARAGIDRLRQTLDTVGEGGRWTRLQQAGLATDLRRLQRDAVTAAVTANPGLDETEAVARLLDTNHDRVRRVSELIRTLSGEETASLDAVAVAVRSLRGIVSR